MPLPDFIRERRVALDLSKSEAARRAGVSRRTWCDIEDGVRPNVTLTTLSQIDQALQIPEGTLYAMTTRSGNRQVAALRQKAMDLLRRMTADELTIFVESQGAETMRSVLAEHGAALMELRAQMAEMRRDGRGPDDGRADGGRPDPRQPDRGRPGGDTRDVPNGGHHTLR